MPNDTTITPPVRRLQAAGDNTSLLVCKCVGVLCRSEVKKLKHKALDYLTRIYKAVLTMSLQTSNMEPMEIGSVDKNGSTNDDTLEDDEYEPIISTPSLQSSEKKLGVSVNQHKIKALKWISSVLAAAVLLYSVKDMFGIRMNREGARFGRGSCSIH